MDTKTLYSKLAAVPPPIKTWLSSDEIVDYVNNIDNQFLLPRESSSVVKKLAQRVLIKDMAPEYFSGELATELKLDKDKAIHISGELKKTIFFPEKAAFFDYGIDIDLLDKFQMPGVKIPSTNSPVILKKTNTEDSRNALPPSTPKPTTLSDVGWSRASSAGPGIKLTTLPNTAAQPQTQPPAAIPIPPPPPQATHTEPAPIMLHEDTAFKAAEKNTGFTLSKPGSGAEVHMNQSPSQAPARPAVLEFGGIHPSTPPQNKPTTTSSSSATHYTELKLSLSAIPTVNSGPRNINQVTSPLAQPPIPNPSTPSAGSTQNTVPIPRPPQPLASMPPQPPKPPQNNKPIVKDFL